MAFAEWTKTEENEKAVSNAENRTVVGDSDAADASSEMEIKEDSQQRKTSKTHHKSRRSKFKSLKNDNAASADVMTILLVILALIIAPLAVAIYEGITNRFWITLILWLIGIGLGFWLFGGTIAWACGLIAAIYAILIVLGII